MSLLRRFRIAAALLPALALVLLLAAAVFPAVIYL